jgi:phage N-6-adenine-methyltransferase
LEQWNVLPFRQDFVMKKRPGRPRKYVDHAARQRAYYRRLKRSKRLVYHRSTTALWETPHALFDALHAEFHFTLDVCALASNAKCDHYFTPDQDGLMQDWGTEVCFANPPYGLILRRWVEKAFESSKAGATVVMLLPVRSDTVWWHTYVLPYAEIRYLPKRLRFSGSQHSAPFPCAVVIFRPPIG